MNRNNSFLGRRLAQARDRRNDELLRRRIALTRQHFVPSVFALLPYMLSMEKEMEREALAPSLLVALEDVLAPEHADQSSAWITWSGRMPIATRLAEIWAKHLGNVDKNRIIAKAYGELTAIESVREKNTVDHRNTARKCILHTLKIYPPPLQTIKNYVTRVITYCRAAPPLQINRHDAEQVMLNPPEAGVSLQTYRFYEMRGHTFNYYMFHHDSSQQCFSSLGDPMEALIDLSKFDPELANDWTATWAKCSDDNILGFYEGLAYTDPAPVRCGLAGSVFTVISSMCQDQDLSKCWVDVHRRRFYTEFPDLNLETFNTFDIVQEYCKMYPRGNLDLAPVYNNLVLTWNHLSVKNALSLTWIIKQNRGYRVICDLAETVTAMKYFDAELLLRDGIPLIQFQRVLRLAADLLYNPLSSIVKPTDGLREYPDLGYIGSFFFHYLLNGPSTAINFLYQDGRAIKSKDALICICTRFYNLNRNKDVQYDENYSLIDIYRTTQPGKTVVIINNKVFQYNTEQHVPTVLLPTEKAQLDAAPAAECEYRRRDAIDQHLPEGAKRVTQEEIVNALTANLTVRAQSFVTIMRELTRPIQKPKGVLPDTVLNLRTLFKPFDKALALCFEAWDVELPAEYTTENHAVPDAGKILPPRPRFGHLPDAVAEVGDEKQNLVGAEGVDDNKDGA